MKRNPHIIVQQVCPIEKNKDGGTHPWKVCTYVFHKGLNACLSACYRTKSGPVVNNTRFANIRTS